MTDKIQTDVYLQYDIVCLIVAAAIVVVVVGVVVLVFLLVSMQNKQPA